MLKDRGRETGVRGISWFSIYNYYILFPSMLMAFWHGLLVAKPERQAFVAPKWDVVQVLNEDALVRICRFLPARPLLDTSRPCLNIYTLFKIRLYRLYRRYEQ